MTTKPEIKLYRGFPISNTFTSSSFVSKLELRLRLGRLPHKIDVGTPVAAPRGKIPYVELSRNSGPNEKAASPIV